MITNIEAGVDGSRTHHGPQSDPSPILKTGEPTGTLPLPRNKHTAGIFIWQATCPDDKSVVYLILSNRTGPNFSLGYNLSCDECVDKGDISIMLDSLKTLVFSPNKTILAHWK